MPESSHTTSPSETLQDSSGPSRRRRRARKGYAANINARRPLSYNEKYYQPRGKRGGKRGAKNKAQNQPTNPTQPSSSISQPSSSSVRPTNAPPHGAPQPASFGVPMNTVVHPPPPAPPSGTTFVMGRPYHPLYNPIPPPAWNYSVGLPPSGNGGPPPPSAQGPSPGGQYRW